MKYRRYCTVDAQIFQAAQLGHGTIYFNINNILRFLRWTGLRIRIRWDSCVFPYTWKNPVFRSCFRPGFVLYLGFQFRNTKIELNFGKQTRTLPVFCVLRIFRSRSIQNKKSDQDPYKMTKNPKRWHWLSITYLHNVHSIIPCRLSLY